MTALRLDLLDPFALDHAAAALIAAGPGPVVLAMRDGFITDDTTDPDVILELEIDADATPAWLAMSLAEDTQDYLDATISAGRIDRSRILRFA